MTTANRKLIMVVAEDWHFLTHRFELAKYLRASGWQVTIATRVNRAEDAAMIRAAGLALVPMPLQRGRLSVWSDLRYAWCLFRLYRRERPAVVYQVAMKPVLYGSLAALGLRQAGVVSALAGLGYLFINDRKRVAVLRRAVLAAFRYFFSRRRTRVILQNEEDMALFRGLLGEHAEKLRLIRGAGVDPACHPLTQHGPRPRVVAVMAARLLRDKGVFELVAAARILRREGVPIHVRIVGAIDRENPTSLTEEDVKVFNAEGAVEFSGHQADVGRIYADADIAVLPSYREGLPRALLEAAAAGLPIVTTDTSGCREVVVHGVNGLLVPVRESIGLAAALRTLAGDPAMRAAMGAAGRERAEKYFSQKEIFAATRAVFEEVAGG